MSTRKIIRSELGTLARNAVPRETKQAEVAQALGVSQASISRAFNGKDPDLAIEIIKYYGGTVNGPFYEVKTAA